VVDKKFDFREKAVCCGNQEERERAPIDADTVRIG
jgi:hypothetical protein